MKKLLAIVGALITGGVAVAIGQFICPRREAWIRDIN